MLQVAVIERSKTRHIINLRDLLAACSSKLSGAGRRSTCSALSFDGIQDFPGLLRELQTVDVLVMPLHRRIMLSPVATLYNHPLGNLKSTRNKSLQSPWPIGKAAACHDA